MPTARQPQATNPDEAAFLALGEAAQTRGVLCALPVGCLVLAGWFPGCRGFRARLLAGCLPGMSADAAPMARPPMLLGGAGSSHGEWATGLSLRWRASRASRGGGVRRDDSVTSAFPLHAQGAQVRMLSCDYGQRRRRELCCASGVARRLGVAHQVVDLTAVGALLGGSALTDDRVAVPEGHNTHESMRATVVPNRNAIMLAVAAGAAGSTNADIVGLALSWECPSI